MGATGSTPLLDEDYPYYGDQFYREGGYYYQDLNYDEEGIFQTPHPYLAQHLSHKFAHFPRKKRLRELSTPQIYQLFQKSDHIPHLQM